MVLEAQRSELLFNTNAIKEAQHRYHARHNRYIACDPYPAFPQKGTQDWNKHESGAFQAIDWSPDGAVRGSYHVSVSEDDFTVMGISDIDGDGVYATFVATKSQQAEPITDTDIY